MPAYYQTWKLKTFELCFTGHWDLWDLQAGNQFKMKVT